MSVSTNQPVVSPVLRSGKEWAVLVAVLVLAVALGMLVGRWTAPQPAAPSVSTSTTEQQSSGDSGPAGGQRADVQAPHRQTHPSDRMCRLLRVDSYQQYGWQYVEALGCR